MPNALAMPWPERPGRHLDAARPGRSRDGPRSASPARGSAGSASMPNVRVAGQMQQRIEQHRAVAVRQHDAVAVGPGRIGGQELQVPREERRRDLGHAERHALMAFAGAHDGVDGEEADRVGELRTVAGWDMARVLRLAPWQARGGDAGRAERRLRRARRRFLPAASRPLRRTCRASPCRSWSCASASLKAFLSTSTNCRPLACRSARSDLLSAAMSARSSVGGLVELAARRSPGCPSAGDPRALRLPRIQ